MQGGDQTNVRSGSSIQCRCGVSGFGQGICQKMATRAVGPVPSPDAAVTQSGSPGTTDPGVSCTKPIDGEGTSDYDESNDHVWRSSHNANWPSPKDPKRHDGRVSADCIVCCRRRRSGHAVQQWVHLPEWHQPDK